MAVPIYELGSWEGAPSGAHLSKITGDFVQNYTARYGMEPSVWAAQPYAAVYILAKAISDAQSTDPTAIRDALADITDFDTILGKFSFNAVGDAVYDPVVLIVEDGELQVFE